MRKEILNGTPIPYDATIDVLKNMMSSTVMQEFSLACEALSYKDDPEAYEIMKSYINDKDKYRRLYVLKTIFRHSGAIELKGFLEQAIASDDFLFVSNGLLVISDYKVKVSDDLLFSVVSRHLPNLYRELYALSVTDACEENYIKLTELFGRTELCAQKEFISDVLIEAYLPAKRKEMFDLFRCDGFAKIRLLAVTLANQYGYDLSEFLSDSDGHVKKLALYNEARLYE